MIKGCFLSIVFAIVLFVSRHLYWGLFFLFFIAPLFFAFAVFLGMDEELTKKRRER